MNGHTHLLGGLVAGAVAAPALASGHLLVFLAAATFAGPLADIDHPGSLYGRWVPLPGVARVRGQVEPYRGGPYGNAQAAAGQVGRATPFGILWHRGPTHSVAACVLASGVTWAVLERLSPGLAAACAFGVGAGYASHLVLDAMNVMGQRLLWPFSRKAWRPPWPRWPVGSLGETAVVVALVGGLFLSASHVAQLLRITSLRG